MSLTLPGLPAVDSLTHNYNQHYIDTIVKVPTWDALQPLVLKYSIHGEGKEQISMAVKFKQCFLDLLTSCICKQAPLLRNKTPTQEYWRYCCAEQVCRGGWGSACYINKFSACYFFTVTVLLFNCEPIFPNSGNERDIKIKPLHISLRNTDVPIQKNNNDTLLGSRCYLYMVYNPQPDGLCESVSIMSKSLLTRPAVNECAE